MNVLRLCTDRAVFVLSKGSVKKKNKLMQENKIIEKNNVDYNAADMVP